MFFSARTIRNRISELFPFLHHPTPLYFSYPKTSIDRARVVVVGGKGGRYLRKGKKKPGKKGN